MADTVSLQVSAIDAEGNGLTYVATGLPAGLSINATGLISGSIATGAETSSPYTVLVTVTDDGTPNESANISFGWSVVAFPKPRFFTESIAAEANWLRSISEPLDWSGDTYSSPSTYVNSSQTNKTYPEATR